MRIEYAIGGLAFRIAYDITSSAVVGFLYRSNQIEFKSVLFSIIKYSRFVALKLNMDQCNLIDTPFNYASLFLKPDLDRAYSKRLRSGSLP